MARVIRFPLRMNDGTDSRTLEDLKAHFDLDSVLGYFADGKLKTWLSDRYYDDLSNAVSELTEDMPDLGQKLCAIFEVEYKQESTSSDIDEIKRRNEKLAVLRNVTDDTEIINNADIVAFTQDELNEILMREPEKVYLYGSEFTIPYSHCKIRYIGLNNPSILLEKGKYYIDYKTNDIVFVNVRFTDDVDIGEDIITFAKKYFIGDGVSSDCKKGLDVLTKCAENGNPDCQFELGMIYWNGQYGIEKDVDKAEEWLRKAADLGNVKAMNNLGCIIELKRPEEAWTIDEKMKFRVKCLKECVIWFWRSAEKNNPVAQFNVWASNEITESWNRWYSLSIDFISEGLDLQRKAKEYLEKSVAQGYVYAEFELGNLYYKMYQADNISDSEKKELSQLAMKWFEKAAAQGEVYIELEVGKFYRRMSRGCNVSDSEKKELLQLARKWLEKASDQNLAAAQYELGDLIYLYFGGGQYEENKEIAANLYLKAAKQGYVPAWGCISRYSNVFDSEILDFWRIMSRCHDAESEEFTRRCRYIFEPKFCI